jgi:hypothetical protein
MSDFKFNCPHCQQSLEAPEEMIGETTECPSCKGQIQILKPEEPTLQRTGLPTPPVVAGATMTQEQDSSPKPDSRSKERKKINLLAGFSDKQRDSRYKRAKEKWEKEGWKVANYFNGGLTQASYIEIERDIESPAFDRASINFQTTIENGPSGKVSQVPPKPIQTGKANAESQYASSSMPTEQPSSSEGTNTSAKTWRKVGYGAIVGSILLGISIPMKWEIIYAGDESMHMTGWIILLDAIGLLGAAVMQRKATTEQEAKKLSKAVMTCAGFAFLYAGYTIVTNWSIGDQSFAGMSAGVRNGPGVWLGLVGGIVALASQVRFMPTEKMNLPKNKDNQG